MTAPSWWRGRSVPIFSRTLAAAVDKAISQGTTLETFRKDFRKIVAEKGWQISPAGQGTKGGEAWRTKVIYKTNLSTSYAAGRFAQLTQAGYPFLVYRHGASVEPRVQHLAWDGLVLPADHPFWKTHCPPNGWGCTCYITGARSKESARRVGGDPAKTLPEGWQAPDAKTGAPVGIDRGWAYAPGATVARTLPILADKLVAMPALTSADLICGWPDRFFDVWSEAFAEFIDMIKVRCAARSADDRRARCCQNGWPLPRLRGLCLRLPKSWCLKQHSGTRSVRQKRRNSIKTGIAPYHPTFASQMRYCSTHHVPMRLPCC